LNSRDGTQAPLHYNNIFAGKTLLLTNILFAVFGEYNGILLLAYYYGGGDHYRMANSK
jgi:hypothetical protein